MTTQTALELITVTEVYKTFNPENIYTLHTDKEQSIVIKKPLQGSDKNKFSLSCRVADTDATFSKIVNGSDKCISVKIASAETTAPMMLLVNIKNVYDSWKVDKVGYFYQDKAIATIAYSAKSDKYQLVFNDSTKIVIDATVCIDKIAPIVELEDKITPDQEPAIAETPAPKLTLDMVYELALQLGIKDRCKLLTKITGNMSDQLPDIAVTTQETTQETTKKKLNKEYPVHYDRLITWLENKYQGVEIKNILTSWGDKEINGVKKLTDKELSVIVSGIEGQEIGQRTVTEELATICYLKALENGVLIPYLTKIGATVSDMLKKLSSTKQTALHTQILKRWEDKKINFATLNNACKAYSKSNPELILRVMIGQAELPKK